MYAGMLLPLVLLASTPNHAQQIARSAEPAKSIISLAPAPKPQGEVLARHSGGPRFEHAPANYHVFAAATVGEDAGVEALTLNFAGETTLTRIESKNNDFVIEPGGTCHEGNSYSRGGSCTLLLRFNPQSPGHRLGFINVTHSADATPMSFGLTGNGYAPVVSFTPSVITTVPGTFLSSAGTIKSATNMAIDGGDILYIADTGNNEIKEMDSTGAIITHPPASSAVPASIAVDSFGVMYTTNTPASTNYFSAYLPWGTTVDGNAPALGVCTSSAPCALSTVGMNSPANISIDANDNLFFEEATKGAAEMPVSGISGGGSFNLWYLSDTLAYGSGFWGSFAVDANGNLYTFYQAPITNTCMLTEESVYDAEYSPSNNRVAGGARCGFSGDGGQARSAEISSKIGQIAFDVAGNLYFADAGNQRIRRIDSTTGIISTVAGSGTQGYAGDGLGATQAPISNPTGVAVDSQGQIYILSNAPSAGPTQAIRKVGTVGTWAFPSQLKGTTSSTKVFNVANTGNDTLTLSANAFMGGPNPGDFAIDPVATNCVLTAGATLQAGHSCNIGIVFKPTAGGARGADLYLMDNTVNGSNVIHVFSTGLLPAPTMAITSPTSGSSVMTGVSVTFSVSVTSALTPKPTGTVTFKVNGTTIGSPVVLSSGTASTTFSEPSANTYTLSAAYSGDSNYAAATVSESLIVTAVKLPVLVSLTPIAEPLSACGGPASFSVKVSSASGGRPTGTVALKSGSSVLASTSLNNGVAALSAGTLPAGSHSFIAIYSGDSLHQPATSSPVTLTVQAPSNSCVGVQPPTVGIVRQPVVQ